MMETLPREKNYLFHGGEVRLIDFGDCGWGHYLYDLAVTVSEAVKANKFSS